MDQKRIDEMAEALIAAQDATKAVQAFGCSVAQAAKALQAFGEAAKILEADNEMLRRAAAARWPWYRRW